jgi:hypothetical protein
MPAPAYRNMLAALEQLADIYTGHMEHAVNPLAQLSFIRYCLQYQAFLGYFMAAFETYIDASNSLQSNKHKTACRVEIAHARKQISAYHRDPLGLVLAP